MKRKYLYSVFIAAIFIFAFASAAGAADYLFKYSESYASGEVRMFSAEEIDAETVGFGIYTCDDEELLEELLQKGIIEYYEPDAVVELMDSTSDTLYNSYQSYYEYKLTNAIGAVNNGVYNGSGVKIGIIDSGLASSLSDIDYSRIVDKYNALNKSSSVEDTYGHGTQVTGVIAAKTDNGEGLASLANQADLVIIKVFEGKKTTISAIINGLDHAYSQGCDVVNMSLGAKGSSIDSSTFKSLENAVNDALAAGMILVAAAGNHSDDGDNPDPDPIPADSPYMYPASFDGVVSVASVDSTGAKSTFSYHNDQVNIAACGDSVRVITTNGSYRTNSGTSFSAPFVTAAAALAKQINPDITSAEFIELLAETASEAVQPSSGEASYETSYGSGIINVGRMLDTLLGTAITVSDLALNSNWYVYCTMTNDGFDSYEILEVWFMPDNGTQSNREINHITLNARSSMTTEYLGWTTVCHLLWFDDNSLIPLCPKGEITTGLL